MRKLIVLLAAAGFLLGFAGSVQAGEMVEESTTLGIGIGGLPTISIDALPLSTGMVLIADGSLLGVGIGHAIAASPTVWSTINFGPGTSLFTGVPVISNLKFTVQNQAGVIQDGFVVPTHFIGGGVTLGPAMGGVFKLNGKVTIGALAGLINLPIPLTKFGATAGLTTMASVLGNKITATVGPFISAPLKITGITENVQTVPLRGGQTGVGFTLQIDVLGGETGMTPSTNGGFVSINGGLPLNVLHTVTISGTNNLMSASKAGMVTVIAPLRIKTGMIANTIPGQAVIKYTFVPEPGTMLLLVSGAVGLAVIGRRRMKK